MSEFGNTSWVAFVVAAYVVTALALGAFAAAALTGRRKALRALKEEGYLSDDIN